MTTRAKSVPGARWLAAGYVKPGREPLAWSASRGDASMLQGGPRPAIQPVPGWAVRVRPGSAFSWLVMCQCVLAPHGLMAAGVRVGVVHPEAGRRNACRAGCGLGENAPGGF